MVEPSVDLCLREQVLLHYHGVTFYITCLQIYKCRDITPCSVEKKYSEKPTLFQFMPDTPVSSKQRMLGDLVEMMCAFAWLFKVHDFKNEFW